MTVLVADVTTRFPELVGNPALAACLAEAIRLVNVVAWSTRADDGVLYLTAHLATMSARAAAGSGGSTPRGPLTSEAVGPLSRSYAAPATSGTYLFDGVLGSTTYGQHYLHLRSLVFACRVIL